MPLTVPRRKPLKTRRSVSISRIMALSFLGIILAGTLLLSLPENERGRIFLRFWTLKEAALKYSGKGLSGGLENVDCLALLDAAKKGTADVLAGRSFLLGQEAVVSIVAQRTDLPLNARLFVIEQSGSGIYGDACFTEQDALLPIATIEA